MRKTFPVTVGAPDETKTKPHCWIQRDYMGNKLFVDSVRGDGVIVNRYQAYVTVSENGFAVRCVKQREKRCKHMGGHFKGSLVRAVVVFNGGNTKK